MTEAVPELKAPDLILVNQDEMLKAFWAERPILLDSYKRFIAHTNPLTKNSMALAYTAGLDDAMKYLARNIKKDGFNGKN